MGLIHKLLAEKSSPNEMRARDVVFDTTGVDKARTKCIFCEVRRLLYMYVKSVAIIAYLFKII